MGVYKRLVESIIESYKEGESIYEIALALHISAEEVKHIIDEFA